jgi:hypothetical protein
MPGGHDRLQALRDKLIIALRGRRLSVALQTQERLGAE